MFENAFEILSGSSTHDMKRADGAAFLRTAKIIYGFKEIGYLGLNLPNMSKGPYYVHLACSDRVVDQHGTRTPIACDDMTDEVVKRLIGNPNRPTLHRDESESECLSQAKPNSPSQAVHVIRLRTCFGETAFFGWIADQGSPQVAMTASAHKECLALANYFHGHMLRVNGNDAEQQLLVSARELDCLSWAAAGKTAWEASRILGISERTVRFHLNAAREKMSCATTTQAVAIAVAQRLITI